MIRNDLDHLLGHLRPPVYRQAARSLGDPDTAEDICQEVLLRVIAGLPSFREEAKVTSWVHRIVYNTIGSHLRRECREKNARERWTEAVGGCSGSQAVDPALDLQTLTEIVRVYAQELPPRQREVFFLRYFKGVRSPEIAAESGLCPGTVRASLHRARRKLMDRMRLEHPRFLAELLE